MKLYTDLNRHDECDINIIDGKVIGKKGRWRPMKPYLLIYHSSYTDRLLLWCEEAAFDRWEWFDYKSLLLEFGDS